MDKDLFEDLLVSISEAGAVLRGEREATRRTSLGKVRAVEVVSRLLASHASPAARLADRVFQELVGIDGTELRELLIARGKMPEREGARRLRDQLAELLDCGVEEASALLGASSSRFRRNDRLSREILDRAYAIVEVYVLVASVLGPRTATSWFGEPRPVLGNKAPRELLRTDYGRRLVRDLVEAL